jgi:ATP-dependent Clp protease adaptor protein ClpS
MPVTGALRADFNLTYGTLAAMMVGVLSRIAVLPMPAKSPLSPPSAPVVPEVIIPPTRAMAGDKDRGDDPRTGVVIKTRPKVKKPSMYKVLMLNDDYTPMEFVVHVLQRFFSKSSEEATRIMLHVHQKGVGVCGVFTFEVAETKVTQVMDLARKNQHPLQCTLEKD